MSSIKKSGKVDGAWELSDNLKELRLRHLEPKRDLIVTIGKEVKALNNATFSKDDEKTITTRDIQPSVGLPVVVRCFLVRSLKAAGNGA